MAYEMMMPRPRKEIEQSGFKDYFAQYSEIGMMTLHPETYKYYKKDEDFDINTYKNELGQMSDVEYNAVIGSQSDEEYQMRKQRIGIYLDHTERTDQDSTLVQLGMGAAASLLSPLTLAPGAGAVKVATAATQASRLAGRVAAIGGSTAAVGAATNIASEYLMEKQGLPVDYTTAGLFGAIGGFGLGSIGAVLTHGSKGNVLARAVRADDEAMLKEVEFTTDGKAFVDETTPPRYTGIKITEWMPESVKDFFSSETAKAFGSKVDGIRRTASRMTHLAYGTKNGTHGNLNMKDSLTQLDGNVHMAQIDLTDLYKQEIKSGSFKGSLADYNDKIGKEYAIKANRLEMKIEADSRVQELRKAHKKEVKNLEDTYEKLSKEHKTKGAEERYLEKKQELQDRFNKAIDGYYKEHLGKIELNKAERTIQKYYNTILEKGKQNNIPELMNISSNRLYFTRQWDYAKIKDQPLDTVINKIYQGMLNHPTNSTIKNKEEVLMKAASEFADDLLTRGFDSNFNDLGVFSSKGTIGIGKNLEGRKIKVDLNEVSDLIHHNAAETMGGYHYWMRGQIAARETFPELRGKPMSAGKDGDNNLFQEFKEAYVQPLHKEINQLTGKDRARAEKELESLGKIFDDLMGFRRMANRTNGRTWTAVRALSNAVDTTMSGMFGFNQLLEIPAAMWATGFNRMFSKEFGSLFNDVHKVIKSGEKSSNDFINELVMMGRLSTFLELQGVNRITDAEAFFNVGKWERRHQKLNHELFKYNGMRTMTAWLEASVASNTVMKLQKLGKNLSDKDLTLLKGWGLNEEGARLIQKELNRTIKFKDGKIQKIGIDQMDPEVSKKLNAAINRSVESGVIQGDTTHLPDWMVDMKSPGAPIVKILTKFLRFPIAANEILLKKGLSEDMAGWTATTVSSTMMAMSMKSLIEEAEIASGMKEEVDRQYSWTDPDKQIKLLATGLGYAGPLGLATPVYEKSAMYFGLPIPGKNYVPDSVMGSLGGPMVSYLDTGHDAFKEAFAGRFDSRDLWMSTYRTAMPVGGFPLLNAGMKTLIEDITYDY